MKEIDGKYVLFCGGNFYLLNIATDTLILFKSKNTICIFEIIAVVAVAKIKIECRNIC